VPILQAKGSWTGELDMRTQDHRILRVWQSMVGEVDDVGGLRAVSSVGRDVTERTHGPAALAHAERVSAAAFSGEPIRDVEVLGTLHDAVAGFGPDVAFYFPAPGSYTIRLVAPGYRNQTFIVTAAVIVLALLIPVLVVGLLFAAPLLALSALT